MCEPATIMAITAIAGTAVSAFGQYKEGQATKAANEYQAQVYENNSHIAKQNAINERQLGVEEARKIRIQTLSKIGSQRSAMAANGIDINQGTATDLTSGTAEVGELDALTTMYNSEKRAINYENSANDFTNQANLSRMSAKNAGISGNINALATGLNGASQISGKWANYRNGNRTSNNGL